MRLDKDVKHTSVDACKMITRATELFVESLVGGSFLSMKSAKRKTIKYSDLEHHVLRKPRLEFLHDHVWAMRPEETAKKGDKENKGEEANGDGGAPSAPPTAPPGTRQMTDFFTTKAPVVDEAGREGGDDGEGAGARGAGADAAAPPIAAEVPHMAEA